MYVEVRLKTCSIYLLHEQNEYNNKCRHVATRKKKKYKIIRENKIINNKITNKILNKEKIK